MPSADGAAFCSRSGIGIALPRCWSTASRQQCGRSRREPERLEGAQEDGKVPRPLGGTDARSAADERAWPARGLANAERRLEVVDQGGGKSHRSGDRLHRQRRHHRRQLRAESRSRGSGAQQRSAAPQLNGLQGLPDARSPADCGAVDPHATGVISAGVHAPKRVRALRTVVATVAAAPQCPNVEPKVGTGHADWVSAITLLGHRHDSVPAGGPASPTSCACEPSGPSHSRTTPGGNRCCSSDSGHILGEVGTALRFGSPAAGRQQTDQKEHGCAERSDVQHGGNIPPVDGDGAGADPEPEQIVDGRCECGCVEAQQRRSRERPQDSPDALLPGPWPGRRCPLLGLDPRRARARFREVPEADDANAAR